MDTLGATQQTFDPDEYSDLVESAPEESSEVQDSNSIEGLIEALDDSQLTLNDSAVPPADLLLPPEEPVASADVPPAEAFAETQPPPQQNIDDLFGDDDEFLNVPDSTADADVETEEVERQRQIPVATSQANEDVEDEEPLAEDYVDGGRLITWSIERPPASPGLSEKIMLLGLPLTVEVDSELFDVAGYAELECKIVKGRQRENYKALRQALAPQKIRVMETDGKVVSNARFVEFSDGSCALFVGKAAYEADAPPAVQPGSWLMETTLEPIYFVHGKVDQRVLFRPPTTMLDQIPLSESNRTRLTTVSKGAESEMRLKRQREQELQEHAAKKKRMAASSSLDASFIERDF